MCPKHVIESKPFIYIVKNAGGRIMFRARKTVPFLGTELNCKRSSMNTYSTFSPFVRLIKPPSFSPHFRTHVDEPVIEFPAIIVDVV